MAEPQFIDHPPRIFVVGISTPDRLNFLEYLKYRNETWNTDYFNEPEAIIEAAGRCCYQSWKNPANRTRREYIQEQIVGHDHLSVAEHLSVNLLCADVPRSTQLETVRHRVGVAYSWESTRFTDKHLRFIVPPRLRDDSNALSAFKAHCYYSAEMYQTLLEKAERETDEGTLKRKRAKEAARSVLPNCLGSDGLVTMNGRELRYFIAKRTDESADLSMREFAAAIFDAVKDELPALFADADVSYDTDLSIIPIITFGRIINQ